MMDFHEFGEISIGHFKVLKRKWDYQGIMKHDIQLHAVQPQLAAPSIAVLRCKHEGHIDPSPVQQLFAQKGDAEAEEIICRVLEDIAYRLDLLQMSMGEHHLTIIAKPARRIQQIALGLGLSDVQSASHHVAVAADQMDGVALSATVARLERAFDLAVTGIWELRDGAH